MDLTPYKNIIVFGGSFDPPHRAHITLPQLVREKLNADLVLYIPAGRAPHKLDKKQTDPIHRHAMLNIALKDTTNTAISTIEIDRVESSRPSYTSDTLEQLHNLISPKTKLRLLFGADQLRIFDKWHEPEKIEELAEPVVMVRPPDTKAKLLNDLPEDQREKWAKRLVELPQIDISSTSIRDTIKNAAPNQAFHPDIPLSVMDYIHMHHLYED
ncbi:nicotinate (nicotinamide) nucleotide adenylyltransferase [Planctomycetota bacterium]|nr:nicotinate (nicotinamide) nucleotide adenylyltransferase [Planctomycetota bacterium]